MTYNEAAKKIFAPITVGTHVIYHISGSRKRLGKVTEMGSGGVMVKCVWENWASASWVGLTKLSRVQSEYNCQLIDEELAKHIAYKKEQARISKWVNKLRKTGTDESQLHYYEEWSVYQMTEGGRREYKGNAAKYTAPGAESVVMFKEPETRQKIWAMLHHRRPGGFAVFDSVSPITELNSCYHSRTVRYIPIPENI